MNHHFRESNFARNINVILMEPNCINRLKVINVFN